jgi:hypothetical protein
MGHAANSRILREINAKKMRLEAMRKERPFYWDGAGRRNGAAHGTEPARKKVLYQND